MGTLAITTLSLVIGIGIGWFAAGFTHRSSSGYIERLESAETRFDQLGDKLQQIRPTADAVRSAKAARESILALDRNDVTEAKQILAAVIRRFYENAKHHSVPQPGDAVSSESTALAYEAERLREAATTSPTITEAITASDK
jgi:hypothetical protein